jgi:UDP-N-acetylmuramate dehydrogenase
MKSFRDYDLTCHNSYRIESVGERVFFPETPEDIATIFGDDTREKVILGGGYNVILSRAFYNDIHFVIFGEPYSSFSVTGNTITAQAGLPLKTLSETALEHGLAGLELYYDIPGSVGGAVFMNAGANEISFGNFIDTVTYFDPAERSFKTRKRAELMFGYRTSLFLERPELIISEVKLSLPAGKRDEIRKQMLANQAVRREKQPWDYPNAGSVFKRPPGRYVGQIMDELGLKGKAVGGAMVSTKHGGFIINHNGKATGSDILELIAIIRKTVRETLGVELELEQRII